MLARSKGDASVVFRKRLFNFRRYVTYSVTRVSDGKTGGAFNKIILNAYPRYAFNPLFMGIKKFLNFFQPDAKGGLWHTQITPQFAAQNSAGKSTVMCIEFA